MKARLPVAIIDTTLLCRLQSLELAEVLPFVLSRVLIPKDVRREVGRGPGKARRRLTRLLHEQGDFFQMCEREDPTVRALLDVDLDAGEAAVIAQADLLGAAAILDEARGRRRAENMSVTVVPTGRLLIRLKEAGAIRAVGPYLTALQEARISDSVVAQLLEDAEERPPE